MCGIVGTLVFRDNSFCVTEPFVTRMRDTMVHRGPDGAGTWVAPDGQVGLGHRRLSIIDLSDVAGQPMSNEDGSLWIVFNGEIYNHADIRRELEKTGRHRWRTDHSDTEVILHAFEEWGIGCLERFRGMFAIALWDARKRELWLIRDRIGIKPLYYSIHHGRIVFASEIKALLQDPDQQRAINEEGLYHYLSFLTVPAPHTLFDGIRKLTAGHWLRVDASGAVEERRYWDVWDHVRPLAGVDEGEIAQRILAELRTAVSLRKVSDVPVGVFLSGGIDSSTNAALFAEGESRPIRTFSIGYDQDYGSYKNELHYARRMAAEVGAEYHELKLKLDDLLDFLPRMVHLQDEPIADCVCVPLYYVSKLARDNGVIVCQVGEGADELFCGYPLWGQVLRAQQLADFPFPRPLKSLAAWGLGVAGYEQSNYHAWAARWAAGQPLFWGGAETFSEFEKQKLLSPRLRRKFRGFSSWEALRPIRQRFEDKAWERSPLHWMSYLDLNVRLPELLLMRVDKMSMGVSLEGRVPFLDHKFVELALSIPQTVKFKNGVLKSILKRSVRGVIPDELIDRKKQGFGVPVQEWLMGRLGRQVTDEVSAFCEAADLLDGPAARAVIQGQVSSKAWCLFNLALWWKHALA